MYTILQKAVVGSIILSADHDVRPETCAIDRQDIAKGCTKSLAPALSLLYN
jgi:hypothetical protein